MVPVDHLGQDPAAGGHSDRQSVMRKPLMKRVRSGQRVREEDDGLPLSDEVLLLIITRVAGDTADLVRCAATCRRWRRLVSSNADFICLHAPPRTDRFARGLALGFFHPDKIESLESPRFVPLPSASRWLLRALGRLPSLDQLADDEGRKIFDASSRVVASRDGRLVVEIHPTSYSVVASRDGHLFGEIHPMKSSDRVLKLCVCNPVSGEVDVLPCLRGDDSPGTYACALLTVDDLLHYCKDDEAPPRSASSYRLVLVFDRDRSFTAALCFCSDAGRWGPEARVTGGRIDTTQLPWLRAAVVHRSVVFWPRLKFALLTLPTVDTMAVAGLSINCFSHLLGSIPGGKVFWILTDGVDRIYVHRRELHGRDIFSFRRRSAMSGLVFFTAKSGYGADVEEYCYTFDVDTWKIDKVASDGARGPAMCGYEMDRVAFLSSLGERDDTQMASSEE
ncbi:hypothetical protein BAE44_0018760 [Dichanthelium oligosanthes]|uniref:F-box domain-containing protein n=1 Tax=Dichanthelium oligosanthes TaxID=888268 RepID=A0A1E5V4Z6_9POAL|nr:hypothetical protein BAE44_0018760 [Dichanthelium oligosanthes]